MKKLLLLLCISLLTVTVHSQSFNYVLTQKSETHYSAAKKEFAIISFSSSKPVASSTENLIVNNLTSKSEIKSVVFDASKTTITITMLKKITIKDLNNILNSLSIVVIDKGSVTKNIENQYTPKGSTY